MYLSPVDQSELITHIGNLKNSSSPGFDGISTKLIKSCHIHIIDPLIYIINLIFTQGTVPDDFKRSALAESILQYGIIVWGGLYSTALNPLNVVQNYILKIIFFKSRLYPTTELYSSDILNIRMLYFHTSLHIQTVSRCRLIIKQFIGLFTKENIGTEEDKAT
ncbi:hypothetical protein NQ317_009541 [Molorchus minor]|uniref:Uncharacterized protein n=1 Tax=Molorchus minor TaxID=1323400 RepID=A0ABQ9J812_9CUCU|nr:hypothetical protein NQ317_009541 [Molorchus minor]